MSAVNYSLTFWPITNNPSTPVVGWVNIFMFEALKFWSIWFSIDNKWKKSNQKLLSNLMEKNEKKNVKINIETNSKTVLD